jgi:hypothetical protein
VPDHELIRVVLLGLPVPLHRLSSEHVDDLLREFALISRTESEHARSVPQRLAELIESLEPAFAGVTDAPNAQMQEAIARSREAINLVYMVPPSAAEASRLLDEMLDEADEYCRNGEHLLTVAMPAEAVRYRRWFLGEFVTQIAGASPTSWAEHAAGRPSESRRVGTVGTGPADDERRPS